MTDLHVHLYAEEGEGFTSSNLDIVGYNRDNKTLYVEFQSGPAVYAYEGVLESTYDMLLNSHSVGSFYANYIQGKYTVTKHEDGYIVPPADEVEDDPIQPETKWLSVPEGETPDFAQNDPKPYNFMQGLTLSTSSRYGVRWNSDNIGPGPFEPAFQALSEADALAQFNAQITSVFGSDFHVKILAVVHYFD